jgi:hypothetical protein
MTAKRLRLAKSRFFATLRSAPAAAGHVILISACSASELPLLWPDGRATSAAFGRFHRCSGSPLSTPAG